MEAFVRLLQGYLKRQLANSPLIDKFETIRELDDACESACEYLASMTAQLRNLDERLKLMREMEESQTNLNTRTAQRLGTLESIATGHAQRMTVIDQTFKQLGLKLSKEGSRG